MVGGSIPEKGWKNGVPVIPVIPEDKMPKDLGDIKLWEAAEFKRRQAEAKARPVIANTEPVGPVKTETSAGAPKTGSEIAARRADESQPLIKAKDMEKILNIVAQVQGEKMPSIAEIQAVEKKIGTFSENVACKPEEMIHWPMSAWFAIGNTDPRALVMAVLEFRGLWRDTLKAEDLVNTAPKSVTTETKIGDTGKKVESISTTHVLAKEELAPKKPGFSFGKKVA